MIYDVLQMSNNGRSSISASLDLRVRFVFFWIVLPGVLVSLLIFATARFCWKGSVLLPRRTTLVMDVDAVMPAASVQRLEEAQITQSATSKCIVVSDIAATPAQLVETQAA